MVYQSEHTNHDIHLNFLFQIHPILFEHADNLYH